MTADAPDAALATLAAYVEERAIAQNRESWTRQVSDAVQPSDGSGTQESLARHLGIYLELARELEARPDAFVGVQTRIWRAVRAFFEPCRVSPVLLAQLAQAMRTFEKMSRSYAASSGYGRGHRRWSCWFRVGNEPARRRSWSACVPVDPALGEPFVRLVRLRNELSRELGHDDFFSYRLSSDGWEPARFWTFLDQIADLTDAPYRRAKAEVDQALAARWKRGFDAGASWQYGDPWAQTAPPTLAGHPSRWIRGTPMSLVRRTLAGLGWSERPFSYRTMRTGAWFPTAFCIHMNRGADIRIAAEIGDDFHSLGLLLHEAGHAAWFSHLDPRRPFLLRVPAHPLLSEGFSLLLQRLPFLPSWVRATRSGRLGALGPRHERAIRRADWCDRLFFARWALALARFEQALYRDPADDLQARYWALVERFQGLVPPVGREGCVDYLSKRHLVTHPAGYPYYLLGQCFASQLARRLAREQGNDTDPLDLDLTGRASMLGLPTAASLALGGFLRDRLFAPGADVDDPFAFAGSVCQEPFSVDAWATDLERLETAF